jgi:hypothetical protein
MSELHVMLSKRAREGAGLKEAGVFMVVTCLRVDGGILNGSGDPRIFQHIHLLPTPTPPPSSSSSSSSTLNHGSTGSSGSDDDDEVSLTMKKSTLKSNWTVLYHDTLRSDVMAAGSNDRTYDIILMQPIL